MAQRYLVPDDEINDAAAGLLEFHSSEESEGELPRKIRCGGPCKKRYPPKDVIHCEVNHPVCLNDANQYTLAQLGSGVPTLKCMKASCEKIYLGTEILRFIDLKIFAGRPKNVLEVMIARVGLVDLVELCPYCVSVVVCGPIAKTTEIKCTNPTCNKSSCRKCKKRSHGSTKTCEEAHKESNECGHCLLDYPPAEIVRCEEGHPFCLKAAKEYAASQLGSGIPTLLCLDPKCGKIFPGKEVLRFIDLKIFAGKPRNVLEAMIARVGVADLVAICPNCVTVVECGPIEKSTVINCTNPECRKSSCRKCEKEAHGTISCEEYEQGKKNPSFAGNSLGEALSLIIEGLITIAIEKRTVSLEIEMAITATILQARLASA